MEGWLSMLIVILSLKRGVDVEASELVETGVVFSSCNSRLLMKEWMRMVWLVELRKRSKGKMGDPSLNIGR